MDENTKDMGSNGTENGNGTGEQGTHEPSVEELMAELAKERAANAKLKSSYDTAASDAAKFKKALREKQSAEEIQNEENQKAEAERQRYIKELEDFKRRADAKDRYTNYGMSAELAARAAEAEVAGDFDALAGVHKELLEATVKAKEAEWYKTRPEANAGRSSSSVDPFDAVWDSPEY